MPIGWILSSTAKQNYNCGRLGMEFTHVCRSPEVNAPTWMLALDNNNNNSKRLVVVLIDCVRLGSRWRGEARVDGIDDKFCVGNRAHSMFVYLFLFLLPYI